MAHVETGHIHLGSSILHHTEGLGNKESKKTVRNTPRHKDSYKQHLHVCMHAHKQRERAILHGPFSYKYTCNHAVYSRKTSKAVNTYHSEPNKDFTDRQTHTYTDT